MAAPAVTGANGDRWLDPALGQGGAKLVAVIATIGEQPVGTVAASLLAAAQTGDRVYKRQQIAPLVVVAGRDADAQRDTGAVAAEVQL